VPSNPELFKACRLYLSEQNSTLWGRAFDIKDDRGLDEAAEWLAVEIERVGRRSGDYI
jgi:hypothetical protein